MDHSAPRGISAAPNESIVRGRIGRVEPLPEGVGARWDLEVTASEPVGAHPDFARARIGTSIRIYVHPGVTQHFEPGEVIEARVTYQGDERGGAFFVKGDAVRRVP